MSVPYATQPTMVLFADLSLSAYSCEDLFQQRALLDASREGLERILDVSRAWPIIGVIAMPLVKGGQACR